MTVRAGEDDVRKIITNDPDIKLTPFITSASNLVDYVDACDTDNDLSDDELLQIEIFLSAHFYSLIDPRHQSYSIGKSSGNYQGQTGEGLRSTHYGTHAMLMDTTGCLARYNAEIVSGRPKIGLTSMQLPESERPTDWQ